jgi:hypothetical protein
LKNKINDIKTSDILTIIVLLLLQRILNISDLVFGIVCGIYVLIIIFLETKGDLKRFFKRVIPFILLAILINLLF